MKLIIPNMRNIYIHNQDMGTPVTSPRNMHVDIEATPAPWVPSF
jgi:hypothetical protein